MPEETVSIPPVVSSQPTHSLDYDLADSMALEPPSSFGPLSAFPTPSPAPHQPRKRKRSMAGF